MSIPKASATQTTDVPFAMYDAFTEVPYSGSQAAVVLHASSISTQDRARIARELGAPATAFVNGVTDNRIVVQFFSTVMELPMCGHGTVCLITRLVDLELLPCDGDGWHVAILDLPKGEAKVEYRQTANGRIQVMLDVATARFTPAHLDLAKLARILGIDISDMSGNLPPEIATGDFIHLCLPMRNLAAMRNLQPDFANLAKFCVSNNLETVATFSTETIGDTQDVHVRDFCSAVGVAESAAAGTTNAALSAYLLRNNCIDLDINGTVEVNAEQGVEIDRPSKVTTQIETKNNQISRLQVGGVASRVLEGVLNVKMATLCNR